LDEVVEEFSATISDTERAQDLQAMLTRGLVRFCASEYMAEIEPLFSDIRGFSSSNHLSVPVVAWI